jgi:hypothetical protein
MKELIKGKWYKFKAQNEIWHMKFEELTYANVVSSSACINSRNVFNYGGNFSKLGTYVFTPVNISEIAHLLPKNHPDLQNKTYELW